MSKVGGKCKQCGKPVGPLLTKDGLRPMRSTWMTRRDPAGLFCTMRCAAAYGVAAASRKPK